MPQGFPAPHIGPRPTENRQNKDCPPLICTLVHPIAFVSVAVTL